MRETDAPVVDFDEVRAKRWRQPQIGRAVDGLRHEIERRIGEGCRDGQGILGLDWQGRQLLAEQGHQLPGQRQIHGILESGRLPLEGTSKLEREQRVPARGGMDPAEGRAGEPDVESVLQDLTQGTEAHGSNRDAFDLLAVDLTIQVQRQGHRCLDPTSQQDPDRLVAKPADREAEGDDRRWVEPLDVVDRNQDGSVSRQGPKRVEERDRDRALVGRHSFGLLAQEGHPQRALLGSWQPRHGILVDRVEEVA